jgi:phosphotriesterase-related protein
MTAVNTVTGAVDAAGLGFTLMHEHILCVNWAMRQSVSGWLDREAFIGHAVEEVTSAKKRGVETIVDCTPVNLGRDIHVIREVAEKAEMQIIAATGYYFTEEPSLMAWSADQLAEFLLPDIEKGIQGTDIKAGIIKCATDADGVTDFNRKLLQATARLHRATGVPITTHTSAPSRNGLAQQEVFREEGVDLSRVVIGHCGDTDEYHYLEKLLSAGSFIGMDRFGVDLLFPDEKRVAVVSELCLRGFSNRLVLSHDSACHIDWFPEGFHEQFAPNNNLRHIPDTILPALLREGVNDRWVFAMTVKNPRRLFEQQQAY